MPLSRQFFHRALVPIHTYRHTKFQRSTSISFRDKERVPKFNVELLAPATPLMLKLLCMLQVLGKVKQFAKFQHRSSLYIMQLCEYVFAIGFPLYVSQNIFFETKAKAIGPVAKPKAKRFGFRASQGQGGLDQ